MVSNSGCPLISGSHLDDRVPAVVGAAVQPGLKERRGYLA